MSPLLKVLATALGKNLQDLRTWTGDGAPCHWPLLPLSLFALFPLLSPSLPAPAWLAPVGLPPSAGHADGHPAGAPPHLSGCPWRCLGATSFSSFDSLKLCCIQACASESSLLLWQLSQSARGITGEEGEGGTLTESDLLKALLGSTEQLRHTAPHG